MTSDGGTPIDPSATVSGHRELEAAVGARPAVIMLKSIAFLDEHCERFLASSPCALVGTTTAAGALRAITACGGPGVLVPRSSTELELGGVAADDLADGAPAGLVALAPGYGETLRINGRLRLEDGIATLVVEEALLHCAKAVMRSGLWAGPGPREPSDRSDPTTIDGFLDETPFLALVSIDGDGRMDVSPRGDPPGLVRRIDDTTIAIADRPGNRRTDTLHNLVDDGRVALLALLPGSSDVVELRGNAVVCTDPSLLRSMRLRDRTPKAAIVIEVEHRERREDGALAAALWEAGPRPPAPDLPPAATIWADHVRRNTDPGVGAKVARRLVSRTALAAGVALDYRTNL